MPTTVSQGDAVFELDHLAVLGTTLSQATDHCERALGVPLGKGGQHAHFGTHNRLLGLSCNLYLEAIAIDPGAPSPGHARWFGMDQFEGSARLDKWILRTNDIDAAAIRFPDAGRPVSLSRGDLHWTMLVPEDGMLPMMGQFPAIIQWHSEQPPGLTLPESGIGLRLLEIAGPQSKALEDVLAEVFADDRITFKTADSLSMKAWFDTPNGERVMS